MRPAARRGRPADVANQEEVGGAPQRTSSHGCAERNPANADAGGPTKGPHTTTRAAPPRTTHSNAGGPTKGPHTTTRAAPPRDRPRLRANACYGLLDRSVVVRVLVRHHRQAARRVGPLLGDRGLRLRR